MFGMFGIVGANGRSPLQWIYLQKWDAPDEAKYTEGDRDKER